MGKGDKKSKRGKIAIGSYGVSRRRRKYSSAAPAASRAAGNEKTDKPKGRKK